MTLNVTNTITALSSMNFTAECTTSIQWLKTQGSQSAIGSSDLNNSINVAFLRAVLPEEFDSLDNETLSDFYTQLADAKPSIWRDPAVKTIQAGCLAPALARILTFDALNLTQNCSATALFYSNKLCGSSSAQPTLTGTLNVTAELLMLRGALPAKYDNVSDIELASWGALVDWNEKPHPNKLQVNQICKTCLMDLCTAAEFTGNPDIGGIGAVVSYVMGAALVTISLLYWLLVTMTGSPRASQRSPAIGLPDPADDRGAFRLAASSTKIPLFGGAIAMALSLSLALLILFIRGSGGSTYYEQLMAENATFIAVYILIILGTYFPLSEFEGPDFAATSMIMFYILSWLQGVAVVALLLDAINRYAKSEFDDEACLRAQLGTSAINNPVLYSGLFLVVGVMSRLLVLLSFTFKSVAKGFRLQQSWAALPPNPNLSSRQKFRLRMNHVFSDQEATSFMIALPLFVSAMLLVGMILGTVTIYDAVFTTPQLRWSQWRELRLRIFQNAPDRMDWWFKKASYGAWVLSFLSLPLMWFDVAFILRVRSAMSVIGGSAWTENQVGFGQVLAIFIWMPVIIGFTLTLVKQIFQDFVAKLASDAAEAVNIASNAPAADAVAHS